MMFLMAVVPGKPKCVEAYRQLIDKEWQQLANQGTDPPRMLATGRYHHLLCMNRAVDRRNSIACWALLASFNCLVSSPCTLVLTANLDCLVLPLSPSRRASVTVRPAVRDPKR